MIDTFAARAIARGALEPSPLQPERFSKHVRYRVRCTLTELVRGEDSQEAPQAIATGLPRSTRTTTAPTPKIDGWPALREPLAPGPPRRSGLRWTVNRLPLERHLWGMTSMATSAASTPTTAWLAATVRSAVAGDEAAFARIVEAYHGDLVRVAYVIAGDGQLAEDAAQATWAIAWRKLGSLRDPQRLRPWLVSVAANEARQHDKQEGHRGDTDGDAYAILQEYPDALVWIWPTADQPEGDKHHGNEQKPPAIESLPQGLHLGLMIQGGVLNCVLGMVQRHELYSCSAQG